MSEKIKERLLIANLVFGIIVFTIFVSWFFLPKTHIRVGYVRIAVVLDKYLGAKEAQRKLQSKNESWQAGADTLKKRLQQWADSVEKANKGKTLSKADQELFQKKRYELENYGNAVQQNAQNEEQKIMEGVFKQINSFVEDYAKEHGYDVILGTTPDGSLMYAHKALDITEEVADALNRQYKK